MNTPRWFTETKPGHSQWYAEHFRNLATNGADLAGEARFLDALIAPGSMVLDAGCGQGRTAGALADRGHRVVATDIDSVLLQAAREDHPVPTYVQADLTGSDFTEIVTAANDGCLFDAAISAGNVITYVAPETEVHALRNVATVLRPDGVYVLGFHVARYSIDDFDEHVRQSNLVLEHRFGTWDLRPFTTKSDFAVNVLRKP